MCWRGGGRWRAVRSAGVPECRSITLSGAGKELVIRVSGAGAAYKVWDVTNWTAIPGHENTIGNSRSAYLMTVSGSGPLAAYSRTDMVTFLEGNLRAEARFERLCPRRPPLPALATGRGATVSSIRRSAASARPLAGFISDRR